MPGTAPRQQSVLTQLAVLSRRYLAVVAADRQYALFLAALPLVLSLLARLVPGSSGLSVHAALAAGEFQPSQLLLVLVLGGALMGIAASIRELVKERPVYRRERAIGLSLGAYLASKLLVLGVIAAAQAAVFTVLALLGRTWPDGAVLLGSGFAEVLVAVVAVTVVTMVVGLLISAFIDNADRGMPLLVLVLMLELVVSGGLFPVHGRPVLEQLAWLVPSRWAYAMGASTVDLNGMGRGGPDPLWEHTASAWLLAAGALALLTLVLVGVTAWLLRRLDPGRR
jgi:ABC transport system ATP-binding/permease protein